MIFTDELVIYSCFLYTTVHFMSQAYHGQAGLFSEGHCRVNLAVVALGGCFRTTGGLGVALMRWIYIKHPSRSGFVFVQYLGGLWWPVVPFKNCFKKMPQTITNMHCYLHRL